MEKNLLIEELKRIKEIMGLISEIDDPFSSEDDLDTELDAEIESASSSTTTIPNPISALIRGIVKDVDRAVIDSFVKGGTLKKSEKDIMKNFLKSTEGGIFVKAFEVELSKLPKDATTAILETKLRVMKKTIKTKGKVTPPPPPPPPVPPVPPLPPVNPNGTTTQTITSITKYIEDNKQNFFGFGGKINTRGFTPQEVADEVVGILRTNMSETLLDLETKFNQIPLDSQKILRANEAAARLENAAKAKGVSGIGKLYKACSSGKSGPGGALRCIWMIWWVSAVTSLVIDGAQWSFLDDETESKETLKGNIKQSLKGPFGLTMNIYDLIFGDDDGGKGKRRKKRKGKRRWDPKHPNDTN